MVRMVVMVKLLDLMVQVVVQGQVVVDGILEMVELAALEVIMVEELL